MEKFVNIKAKTSLQLLSKTKEIDFRYPKYYKPVKKKTKSTGIIKLEIKIYLCQILLLLVKGDNV